MTLFHTLNNFIFSILLIMVYSFFTFHFSRESHTNLIDGFGGKVYISGTGCVLSFLILLHTNPVPDTSLNVDLRSLVLLVASYLGGIIPVLIIGCAQILLRALLFGIDIALLHVSILSVLVMVLFITIDKIYLPNQQLYRWIMKSLGILIMTDISLFILLSGYENRFDQMRNYTIIFLISSILEFYLLESIRKSFELFRSYKNDSKRDFLTGLTNTREFDHVLNHLSAEALAKHITISCLIIDIDYFKQVNDSFGHTKGDIVLQELASLLTSAFPTPAVVARIGGEEFCILIQNCMRAQARQSAEEFRKVVQEHRIRISAAQSIHITVSVGLSNFPESTDDISEIKKLADNALYKAKHSGRNHVCSL
ncbi:MAG: GGDEF domain-containing protein [Lachnospiraceae bacterium]